MKHLLMLLIVVVAVSFATAQPWIQNLSKNKNASELTLKDYQEAFYSYWESFNLERGYYIDENGQKRKASGWKQFKRWEWFMESQVDAITGTLPIVTAPEVIEKWRSANKSENKSANWEVLGPNESTGGYAGIGRINCIAFHPTDNNIYWIGAPAGGLWLTTDNGSSWTCLTDNNEVLGISDIHIPDDFETSNTIYVATGDRNHWDNNSVGVLKSTDGGSSWQNTGLTFNVAHRKMVTRLLVDPDNEDVMLAATSDGIYKTTDAGLTWSDKITALSFIDMEYKPGDFNVLYGSTTNGSIYVTHNAGQTWSAALSTGLGRIELAVSPAADTVVYAIATASDNGLHGIYKSGNSGVDFSLVFDEKNLMGWYEGGSDDQGGQGWYDLSIAVSPADADIVLIGGINTWRSINGGETWSMVNHWYGGFGAQAVHADKHMLKYRSNNDLFECNDGGIYISDNDGASNSWTDITNGMEISQIYRLGVAASVDNQVILGLQDNGTKTMSNSGYWNDVIGGDGMECLIDYSNHQIQYGSLYYGQIHRTTNSWNGSSNISPSAAGNGAWVTPYIIDPVNPQTLYAGYANVWKTTNRGDTWVQISTMNSNSKLRNLAVAPSNNQVLYAADPYTIWKTTDGGDSWTDISDGLPSNSITYITVKHDDPNTVWLTFGDYDVNGVFETSDGGASWFNISDGLPQLPVLAVVQNKWSVNEAHLYVGTGAGVFIKIGDAQWESYNTNLPNVYMGELEIYYDEADMYNSSLYAASFGRGLWKSPLYMIAENPPVINTVDATDIVETSVVLNASILDDFGSSIAESGFVLSTIESFDYQTAGVQILANEPVVTVGDFSQTIEGLSAETTYYFRAYAINEYGIGYGVVKAFTTQEVATYTVKFNITNATTGSGVSDAKITVHNTVLTTNSNGWAQVFLPNGNYDYSLVAEGYSELPAESFDVNGSGLTINKTISQVGLSELENSELELYPNPVTSELNINIKGVFNAEIFDLSGKSVMQKRIYRQATIETGFLSSGVYFIHFENNTHKAVRQFVIQ